MPRDPSLFSPLDFDDAWARRAFGWFMLLALVVLAAGIGLRDPWPPDEPRFTLIARQMVESGQWLFPHRGIELYADKPPMLMWLEALCYLVVRSWRVAFLLPSLLAGLGTLALVYDLGRRLWSARTGLAAAALLLCAMQFTGEVREAQIDPLVMFFITLGNWGLLVHLLAGPRWGAFWLGCFAAGLGVITKGVGVIALLLLLPYALARLRHWQGLAPLGTGNLWRWLGGALAFFAAIALWVVPMLWVALRSGDAQYVAYARDILLHQTADRYAHSWAHIEPFWFFLTVMLRDWFPLSLLALACIPLFQADWRARDARTLLPLLWWLLVLVFFSIPPGKRTVYVLPVVPMVALLLAPHLRSLLGYRWLQRLCFALAATGGVLLVAAGLLGVFSPPKAALRIAASYELDDQGRALWWLVVGAGAALLLVATAWRPRRGIAALLTGIVAAQLVWTLGTYPLLNGNQSDADIMQRAERAVGSGQLALVGWREELALRATGPVTEFGFSRPAPAQWGDALAWQRQDAARRLIVVSEEAMPACVNRASATRLGQANRLTWWLVPAAAIDTACRALAVKG